MTRISLMAGAAFALLGVVAGAAGAHALDGLLDAQAQLRYELAVRYQTVHALALLIAGILGVLLPGRRWWHFAAVCWIAGVIVFSGSLYALSLGAPAWAGAITPIGGLSLILGWISLLIGACSITPES